MSMGVKEGKGTGRTMLSPGKRLKVSSVGDLTISIGSLFHEMGSLTAKAAFRRSKRKLLLDPFYTSKFYHCLRSLIPDGFGPGFLQSVSITFTLKGNSTNI